LIVNWTSQAMTDVVDTINPMKWEGGNVEIANTAVDNWIEGAANDTAPVPKGTASPTGASPPLTLTLTACNTVFPFTTPSDSNR
jgi:hypothetical protein